MRIRIRTVAENLGGGEKLEKNVDSEISGLFYGCGESEQAV